jgi:ankyrin repeat protein
MWQRRIGYVLCFLGGAISVFVAFAVTSRGKDDIRQAVLRNDTEAIQRYIDAGANPSAGNIIGLTPLHFAVDSGYVECVAALLEGGAYPTSADGCGDTPLHHAAREHRIPQDVRIRMIGLLLEACRNYHSSHVAVNVRNINGRTPLHEAARAFSPDVVEYLLDAGADPNDPDAEGRTPLFSAYGLADMQVLRLLVERGADMSAQDYRGRTIVDLAIEDGQPDRMIETLRRMTTQQELARSADMD